MIIVSACLLGLHTRFDGETRIERDLIEEFRSEGIVPVCPEQWGGLPTPRPAALIVPEGADGHDVLAGRARLVNTEGVDVTENYLRGARETLGLAQRLHITRACLKSKSPSCGLGELSDGQGGVRPGDGVTAALLIEHGIEVLQRGR